MQISKAISVAKMTQFCRYSKDRAIAKFKIHVRGANGASFNLWRARLPHFFRFDVRGESYLIPIFLEDRTIANVQQIFGGEDGDILIFSFEKRTTVKS